MKLGLYFLLAILFPGEESELPFKVSLTPSELVLGPRGEGEFIISFDVPAGHCIYRKSLNVSFDLPQGFCAELVQEPHPVSRFDRFLEETVLIYPKSFGMVYRVRAPSTLVKQTKADILVSYQGCSKTLCYRPERVKLELSLRVEGKEQTAQGRVLSAGKQTESQKPSESEEGLERRLRRAFSSRNILKLILLGFIAGLLLDITPCIYPMIPITLSVIGARTLGSPLKGLLLSVFYVLGISLVYSVMGVSAALLGGAIGATLSSPWVVGFVVAVFIALALSMFGFYEISVPPSVASKLRIGKAGGLVGAFLFGAVAGLVASPCISAPLLALLTAIGTSKDVVLGFVSLFSVGWGMGVPLIVLGAFPSLVSSLPGPGSWMVTAKHLFGVLLISAGLYYLGFVVPEKILLGLWGVFLITLSVFLGVGLNLESSASWTKRFAKALGYVALIVGALLLIQSIRREDKPQASATAHRIAWKDREALTETGRPTLIYFSAKWCTVCKQLEKKTFSDPRVIEALGDFNAVKIDGTNPDTELEALHKRFSVLGYPFITFLDAEGNELRAYRISGFISAEKLLRVLQEVK